MDAFQIALIAVLSPILLAAGILQLISTAQLGATAVAFNLMAVVAGGLRFAWNPPGPLWVILTAFFAVCLILALAADTRLCIRFSRSKTPTPDPAGASEARRAPLTPSPARPVPGPRDPKGVKILSPTAWLIRNTWGDTRLFAIPPSIAAQNPNLPNSDRRFRILYDEEEPPIQGIFTASSSLQILLPPEHLEKLRENDLIRFEIVG
ncbi:MAG: hypothetical protein EXS64_14665 [Candidatus Latescibacteria bacterium]|nr:hypothetical protein [Candidatus Latescibacterota bacterium]